MYIVLMQRQEDKIEWAAGLFEGEGNIYRNDIRRAIGSGYAFNMSLKMKDEDIVKRFYPVVKVGKVKARKIKEPYNYPFWEWTLGRTNEILDLCKKLLPFMGKRRTKQIKVAIKGKKYLKKHRILKVVPECNYMKIGEISSRGARNHVRKGEKPCIRCAENQREYLRRWRKAFYKANK